MKRVILLLVLWAGLSCLEALSSHLVGGDLSYKYVGNNRYEVTLVIYKDCFSSTPLDDPATITIFNQDNGIITTASITLDQTDFINTGTNDPCILNPPDVCLERGLYQSNIALPPNTNGYKLVYQRCCRNGSISNILSPGETGSTYDVNVPGQAFIGNSSPSFSDFPPPFLCAKSRFEFNFSAIDPDGDSLVYSLAAPQHGASTFDPNPVQASSPPYASVTYAGGFTYTKPFGTTSSISIDPSTGLLVCIPQNQGQFVVGIAVSEYRNGVLLGRIMRDFQFNVTDCSSTSSIPGVVIDNTNAIYQLDDTTYSSCNGLTVNFKNYSSGNILSNFWDFGDPARTDDTSLLNDPVYTFADTGRYRVTLIVNRGQACGDTTTVEVRVYRELVGNFSFAPKCVYNAVPFIDSSYSYYNDIVGWKWYFGDGDSIEVQNPSHLYANAGTYNVNLIATTQKGCKVKATKPVTVHPKPKANFTVPAACLYAPVKLTNTSTITGSGNSIVDNFWYFGPGDTTHTVSPNHSFQQYGSNPVKLTVTSDKNCIDTITKNVNIADSLRAGFNMTDSVMCKNNTMLFTSTSAGTSMTHNWNFGDNTTSTQVNPPAHNYPNAGNYSIRVVVSNAICGSDTAIKTLRVYDGLNVNFGTTPNCFYNAILFRDSSSATYNDINSYSWNFGDGSTSTSVNPPHLYSAPGTYNISLTVTTAGGCSATKTGTVQAYPKPTANFTIPLLCLNKPFTLTNTSTISSGSITQYLWNYGSSTSNAVNPTLSFPVSGIHPVKLTATSDKNCIDTITKNVDIQDSIKANFTFNDSLICKLNVTQLTSTSMGRNLMHNWNFGDNTTSTQTNPTHQYAAAGNYPIKLKISNAACGSDSITKNIRVFDGGLNVDWRAFNDCFYKDIFFKDSSVALFNDITGYTWTFGDGDTVYTQNATHQYATPGTYSATFTVTTARGCINTVRKNIEAYPAPVADFNAPVICLYKPFTLQNTSTITRGTIPQYTWDFGNGTILTTPSPQHTLNQPGNYPVELLAVSDRGCRDSVTKNISVTDSLRANFAFAKPSVCFNEAVTLLDSSIGTNISYAWDFGDNISSTDINPTHTYTQVASYDIRLTVSSPTCGSDSMVKRIDVLPLPVVELGAPIELCPGNTELVQVTRSAYDSLRWSNGATTDTISATTDLNPLQVTVYKNGCSGSDILDMIIKCPVFIPTAFTPNYDGLNDVYQFLNKNIKSVNLKIFNRWGQLIFESSDLGKAWDGTYKDQFCLVDEYIYVASGITMDDQPFSVKGTFSLLR